MDAKASNATIPTVYPSTPPYSKGARSSHQYFSLRWNNYQSNMTSVFHELLETQSFVDVTLACEYNSLKAHKVVLSACSAYFQKILLDNPCKHPTIILPSDICFSDLQFIIEFVYRGEIDVSEAELQAFWKQHLVRTASNQFSCHFKSNDTILRRISLDGKTENFPGRLRMPRDACGSKFCTHLSVLQPKGTSARLGRFYRGPKRCAPPSVECVDIAVKSIIIHPRFDTSSFSNRNSDYNIALAELETPADLNNYINTICLPKADFDTDITEVLLTSWTFTARNIVDPSNGASAFVRVTEIDDLMHATFGDDSTLPAHLKQNQEKLLAPGAALQWVDNNGGQVLLVGVVTHKDSDGYMVSVTKPAIVDWILSVAQRP